MDMKDEQTVMEKRLDTFYDLIFANYFYFYFHDVIDFFLIVFWAKAMIAHAPTPNG